MSQCPTLRGWRDVPVSHFTRVERCPSVPLNEGGEMSQCPTLRGWRDVPVSHFTRVERCPSVPLYEGTVRRNQFSKSIHNLNRGNLRKATMFLTGHVALNYYLNKYKPDKISKTCPHCLAAEKTTNHYIGQCPKWSAQRITVFDSFYPSLSELEEDSSIFGLMK